MIVIQRALGCAFTRHLRFTINEGRDQLLEKHVPVKDANLLNFQGRNKVFYYTLIKQLILLANMDLKAGG